VGDVLPAEWRRDMVDMIRGAAPLSGAWFRGGPGCTPEQQIGIYRDQYRLRLLGAVKQEALGLKHLLGEEADEVLWRFVLAHPSKTWTLDRIAGGLPEWLRDQPEGTPERVDMARLDAAVQRGFTASEGNVLTPDQILSGPVRLTLAPHVGLLRLRTTVHETRSALMTGAQPPAVREEPVHLVVFRRGIKMRHWAVSAAELVLLEAIARGLPLAEAIEEPVRTGAIDGVTLAAEIGGWFEAFAERRLLVAAGEA
jgi:hypothetical protein